MPWCLQCSPFGGGDIWIPEPAVPAPLSPIRPTIVPSDDGGLFETLFSFVGGALVGFVFPWWLEATVAAAVHVLSRRYNLHPAVGTAMLGMLSSHLLGQGIIEPALTGAAVTAAPTVFQLPPIPGIGVILPVISPWFGIGGLVAEATLPIVAPSAHWAVGTGLGLIARDPRSPWRWGAAGFFLGLAAGYSLSSE